MLGSGYLALDQTRTLCVLPVNVLYVVLLGAPVEHVLPEGLLRFVLLGVLLLHISRLFVDVCVEFFDLDVQLRLVFFLLIDR